MYTDDPEPWLDLRNAIIAQAVADWKRMVCYPDAKIGEKSGRVIRRESEQFLLSEWCHELLTMDESSITGEVILKKIRQYTMEDLKGKQEETHMNVTLIQQTPNPVQTIADIASICYDKRPSDPHKLVKMLYLNGHHSPFEHIYFTFKIEGISRACSHQLVRHRLASFTQRSQRYCEENGYNYVLPDGIAGEDDAVGPYCAEIQRINDLYTEMIHLYNVKKEDARYLLPNACTTSLYLSCNLRQLIHMANERLCARAQWEIRQVVSKMVELVDSDIRWMLVPKCESGFLICNSPCGRNKPGYKLVRENDEAEK